MKKFVAAFVAVVFSCTLFFALPYRVEASGLEWLDEWLDISGGWSWFGYIAELTEQQIADLPSDHWSNLYLSGEGVQSLLDGTAGQSKPYYTGSDTGLSYSGNTADIGGGGGRDFTITAHQSGTAAYVPSAAYNTTSNNYSFYQPSTTYNSTTNNYYNQYDISNVYYNQQYNTYLYQTTNNYNYYVTYSPTYYNITYLDSGSGSVKSDVYYYKLPDGRNSFDLKAADVYGQYFIYDVANYDTVIEAPGVEGLWHLDGNLEDSGPAGKNAVFTGGPSISYVDSGAFNQALYLDNTNHVLVFDFGSVSAIEWRMYLASPVISAITSSGYSPSYKGSSVSYSGNLAPSFVTQPRDTFSGSYLISVSVLSGWTDVVYGMATAKLNVTTYSSVFDILRVNGVSVLQYGFVATGVVTQDYFYNSTTNTSTWGSSFSVTTWTPAFFYRGKLITLSYGSWLSFNYNVADDRLFFNGVEIVGGTSAYAPKSSSPSNSFRFAGNLYGNYAYLDEVRASSVSRTPTVATAPFDTSKVLVLPEAGEQGSVAIKSSVPVTAFRVGGVRPSNPAQGNVYISLDSSHKVTSAQQYNSGNWGIVDGAIYDTGAWVTLSGYSMKNYTIEDPDPGGSNSNSNSDSGGSSSTGGGSSGSSFDWDEFIKWLQDNFGSSSSGSSGSDSGSGGDDGDSSGSFLGWLWNGITALFGWIFGGIQIVLDWFVSALSGLASSVLLAFRSVLDIVGGFILFLSAIMVFVPSEIVSAVVVGIVVLIILSIIKHFRGD